jgi:hypothetical protein
LVRECFNDVTVAVSETLKDNGSFKVAGGLKYLNMLVLTVEHFRVNMANIYPKKR